MAAARLSGVLLCAAFVLAGCASSTESADGLRVDRAELGDDWPLTIEAGELRCDRQAVTIEADGTTYAVNGTARDRARSQGNDWHGIEAVWADDTSAVQGVKKDIGPLLERGRALC